MPSEKGDMQAVTVWIHKDTVDRIEKLAAEADMTRSKLITNIIDVGVEELEVMDKLKLWAAARVFEDIRQYLRARHQRKTETGKKKSK